MREMAALAAEAARAGARELRARAADLGRVRTKSSAVDVVTEADVASGVAVVGLLKDRVGSALRVVVEEDEVYGLTGIMPASPEEDGVWLIDPLDGTTSFVHGYPCYSVSVALLRSGQPVAGAVYNLPAEEMSLAWSGGGAWMNGKRVSCSAVSTRERALLATGFPYEREAAFTRQMRVFERLVRGAHDVRRDGSAAVDCCHVAAGRCDGYWEFGLKTWDMAAGVVILREAGVLVTDIRGEPWTTATADLLAANARLHGLLLADIAAAEER
ncbi:MAG: inositol monophosphatase [Coriobacteriia bacterium]|nr:inositol monophosphatase [Coriobacteriia bacterium]